MTVGEITRRLNEASARRPWRTAVLVALALAPAFALAGWLTGPPAGTVAFTLRWVVVAIVVLGAAGVIRRSRESPRDGP